MPGRRGMEARDAAIANPSMILALAATIMVVGTGAMMFLNGAIDFSEKSRDRADGLSDLQAAQMDLEEAYGQRTQDGGVNIRLFYSLVPATGSANLSRTQFTFLAGDASVSSAWEGRVNTSGDAGLVFSFQAERDADASLNGPDPKMTQGDLIEVTVDVAPATLFIDSSKPLGISQSEGNRTGSQFSLIFPSGFDSGRLVRLVVQG